MMCFKGDPRLNTRVRKSCVQRALDPGIKIRKPKDDLLKKETQHRKSIHICVYILYRRAERILNPTPIPILRVVIICQPFLEATIYSKVKMNKKFTYIDNL